MMAGRSMRCILSTEIPELRIILVAYFRGEWAARVESAPGWRSGRIRYVAREWCLRSGCMRCRIGHRDRGNERARVWVQWSLENIVTTAKLDNPTEVHNGNAIAQVPDH